MDYCTVQGRKPSHGVALRSRECTMQRVQAKTSLDKGHVLYTTKISLLLKTLGVLTHFYVNLTHARVI